MICITHSHSLNVSWCDGGWWRGFRNIRVARNRTSGFHTMLTIVFTSDFLSLSQEELKNASVSDVNFWQLDQRFVWHRINLFIFILFRREDSNVTMTMAKYFISHTIARYTETTYLKSDSVLEMVYYTIIHAFDRFHDNDSGWRWQIFHVSHFHLIDSNQIYCENVRIEKFIFPQYRLVTVHHWTWQ